MNEQLRRVVVTGMGAVSPVGNTLADTWDNLIKGVHGIGPITLFDATDYKATLAAEVKDFNPRDYMDKQEILRSDRYSQLAIAAATQAVEESGVLGSAAPERMAVYFGTGIGGVTTITREHHKLFEKGPGRVSPYLVPMMIANMAAGMIAIRYNCQGAAMPSVTACDSGANAIGEAVRAIRHGYADVVISGGSDAAVNECGVAGFINMHALSTSKDPEAASLPFDARRAGFVIGEGAAALVLEDYEHAVSRGAKIIGEISGYGVTCDAYHITSPRPDASGGARAMTQALEESGYRGDERIYVNAHGTGTPLNDKGETIAIKTALGEEKAHASLVSSTKSMTGHMLGAAGALEAVVCLKVLETGWIPPTIHLLEADPDCDLNYVPNQAVQAEVDLCISNSLGFGGHNASLAFRKVKA
ncbi:MAG: beta-ketoacyl-ACP synthase II [Peptococcaceae bacterium]|nr:beta-ketoacyl-ACP synthase II [Peptococcaceae bacterium]